jgi:predicted ATP-grasp superfamily ATP-dependent carboligase
VARGSYLQEFVDGVPGSVVFMSGAGRCVPAAVTQQIVGDAAFGASGFRYCGSLLASAGPVGAERLAAAVTEAFGLVGLNVVDFIARDGVPYAIEVNPRWSASMELVDEVVDTPLFGIHARLCLSGEPPPVFLSWRRVPRGAVVGKAIVFARRDGVIPDTDTWLEDPEIRDVPHAGERMTRGQPVCTVLADGLTAAACYEALARKAADVYRILDPAHRFEGQFDA